MKNLRILFMLILASTFSGIHSQGELSLNLGNIVYGGTGFQFEYHTKEDISYAFHTDFGGAPNRVEGATSQLGIGGTVKFMLTPSDEYGQLYAMTYINKQYGKWDITQTSVTGSGSNLIGTLVGLFTLRPDIFFESAKSDYKITEIRNRGKYTRTTYGIGMGYHMVIDQRIVIDASLGLGITKNKYTRRNASNTLTPKRQFLHLWPKLIVGYRLES